MFEIGDYIIYGNNGVCKVVEIGPIKLGARQNKTEKPYYTLEPVYDMGSKIYTPVGNKKVLMRKVISKDEALKLIDNIPNIEYEAALISNEGEQKIKEALIKSIAPEERIKVIKALHYKKEERLADGKKMTSSDEKYLKDAKDSLYGELSISLDIDKEEIEEFILDKLQETRLV